MDRTSFVPVEGASGSSGRARRPPPACA